MKAAFPISVLLDTNILVEDFFLTRPHFELLLRAGKRGDLKILVPAVVLAETIGNYERQAARGQQEIDNAIRNLARLKIELGVKHDSPARPEQYQLALRFRLGEGSTEILPYPSVDHEVIAQRAIARRRPFKDDGKGYRDTLIWYSVLERAAHESLVFVTRNLADFGDQSDSSRLHPDLVADLEAAGLPSDAVDLRSSLEDALDAHVPRSTKIETELQAKIDPSGPLAETFGHQLASVFSETQAATYASVPFAESVPEVVGRWFSDFQVESAHELGNEEFAVEVSARADLALAFSANYDDAQFAGHEIEIHGLPDEWGSVAVTYERAVHLEASALYLADRDELLIESIITAEPF